MSRVGSWVSRLGIFQLCACLLDELCVVRGERLIELELGRLFGHSDLPAAPAAASAHDPQRF